MADVVRAEVGCREWDPEALAIRRDRRDVGDKGGDGLDLGEDGAWTREVLAGVEVDWNSRGRRRRDSPSRRIFCVDETWLERRDEIDNSID